MKESILTRSYICILAANFLMYFGFWLLVPVLPFYLKETFSCSEGAVGTILSSYVLSALCTRPFMGYLYDGFPRKPIYIVAYIVFTAVFLGYMYSRLLAVFVFLRAVHGVAFGTVTVGGNTIVIDITPSSRRGEALGYYGLTNNTAMSIGPMVGLFLHGLLSFDAIFACALCSCFVGLFMASLVKTPVKTSVRRPPLSLDRFILLKGIPAGVSLLLLSIPYSATTLYVALYAGQIGLDVPSGFFFTVMAVGMGISRLFSGKYVDKGYVTQTIAYGFYLVTAAFFLLSCCSRLVNWNVTGCGVVFYLVALMLGVGFGTMFPAYNTLYVNLASHSQRGTATSTYLTSWDVGTGLGMISGGLIAEYFAYDKVYLFGAVLCIVSMTFFHGFVTPHFQRNKLR